MGDEEVARRMGLITLRSGFDGDIDFVSDEEWVLFRRVVREVMVPNWQRLGVLPKTASRWT